MNLKCMDISLFLISISNKYIVLDLMSAHACISAHLSTLYVVFKT